MHRFLAGVLIAIALLPGIALADSFAVGGHITTQTTTTLVTLVAGQRVYLFSGTFCVDASGATTALTLVDSAGTNLVGTSLVQVVAPGQCWKFDPWPQPGVFVADPTAVSRSLQLVTGTGNGPVNWRITGVQR